MTGDQLIAALQELGMSRAGFARMCGVARETVYRWTREEGDKGYLTVPQYAVTIIEQRRQITEACNCVNNADPELNRGSKHE